MAGVKVIPGIQLEEIQNAIMGAFSRDELAQAVRKRLNIRLEVVVGNVSLESTVFVLLEWVERRGLEIDLIEALHRQNPSNPALAEVYKKYGLMPRSSLQYQGCPTKPHAEGLTAGGLEKAIRDRIPLIDMEVWRTKFAHVEGCVCRISDSGRSLGTGILVGPDTVLTNFHVLQDFIRVPERASSVRCVFDYKVCANGSRIVGPEVCLRKLDWLLDYSPYSPSELRNKPDDQLPSLDELDFALVRLDREIGLEPIDRNGELGGPTRGWIFVPPDVAGAPYNAGMPLMIAQYPDGQPLKLAIDTQAVLDLGAKNGLNANGTRVRYATNTEGGSSGSPCFDFTWQLVALHHWGDPAYQHPRYNQGIPIGMIYDRLQRRKKLGYLGTQLL